MNAKLIYKKTIDDNTSILVTYNQYSNDYQIRLNHSKGASYQNASTLERAALAVKEYLKQVAA